MCSVFFNGSPALATKYTAVTPVSLWRSIQSYGRSWAFCALLMKQPNKDLKESMEEAEGKL